MSSNLRAIANIKLTGKETEADWQKYCDIITESGRFREYYLNREWHVDYWEYEIDEENQANYGIKKISLDGPCSVGIALFPNLGYIATMWSFSHLYEFGSEAYDKDSHFNVV